jgi:hypothetical protein
MRQRDLRLAICGFEQEPQPALVQHERLWESRKSATALRTPSGSEIEQE